VIAMAKRLAQAGASEIILADTIGVAAPASVKDVVSKVREVVGEVSLRMHFHNTRNTGLANAWVAYELGVTSFDSSLGGLGGCPFAPNAAGNIATEDLAYMLNRSNVSCGLDLNRLIDAARWLGAKMGRTLPSMVSRAGGFPMAARGSPAESGSIP
jgi:hydroxymethylglutaryl-CoA lyase